MKRAVTYFVLRKELGMTREEVDGTDSQLIDQYMVMLREANRPREK